MMTICTVLAIIPPSDCLCLSLLPQVSSSHYSAGLDTFMSVIVKLCMGGFFFSKCIR
jgi:hypothetical protein